MNVLHLSTVIYKKTSLNAESGNFDLIYWKKQMHVIHQQPTASSTVKNSSSSSKYMYDNSHIAYSRQVSTTVGDRGNILEMLQTKGRGKKYIRH